MQSRNDLVWLFFRVSGRLNRNAYGLAVALSYLLRMFLLYQLLANDPTTAAGEMWALLFMVGGFLSLWVNVVLSVKRLHDFDKPGLWAVSTIFFDIVAVILIAIFPSTPGPNQYGRRTNEPA